MADWFAPLVSVIALVVSLAINKSQRKVSIQIAKTGLMAQYYDDIYKGFLIDEIPKARNEMRFDLNNRLQDVDSMVRVLNDMRKKSLYFYYTDKTFYDELVQKLQELEDYLTVSENKVFEGEGQTAFLTRVKDNIEGIYQLITEHYQGTM